MSVARVGFVGMRTERFTETVHLLRDVMGVPVEREGPDAVGFRMADGALLEVYGTEDEFHAFFTTGPVVGFEVDDFDRARADMRAAGVRFLGAPQHDAGVSWQHFRGPDGTVCEIIGPGAVPVPGPAGDAGDADGAGDGSGDGCG